MNELLHVLDRGETLELLLAAVVQATLASALALGASRFLERHAAVRHFVLAGGLLLLLLTPLASGLLHAAGVRVWTISLAQQTESEAAAAPNDAGPAHSAAPHAPALRDVLAGGGTADEAEDTAAPQTKAAAQTGDGALHLSATAVWPFLLLTWSLGIVVCVLRFARNAWRVARIVSTAVPLTQRQRERLESICSSAGIARSPQFGVCPLVRVPAVAGWWRPRILLPVWFLRELSDEEVRDVLLHEWAHIARGDQHAVLIQELAAALWWWHPLVHLLNRRLGAAREELCDNWALAARDPIQYGETLLHVGALASAGAPVAVIPLSVVAGKGALLERITRLLDPGRRSMTRVHRGWAFCLAATLALLGAATASTRFTFAQQGAAAPGEPPAAGNADAAERKDAEAATSGKIYFNALLRVPGKNGGDEEEITGIIAVDPTTGKWKRLTEGYLPRVSPDGETIMFHRDGDLWNCDAREAAGPGRVARNVPGRVAWTPDSRYVIASQGKFIEDKGWDHTTLRIRIDGATRETLPIPATDGVEDLSPDGKWLITCSDRHPPKGSGYQLYRMRLDGSEQKRLTKDGLNVYARFSPDGRRIVYLHQTGREGNSTHVLDLTSGKDTRITHETGGADSAHGACWSPDGRRLVVIRFDWQMEDGKRVLHAGDDAHYRLELMDPEGANVKRVELKDATIVFVGMPDWR